MPINIYRTRAIGVALTLVLAPLWGARAQAPCPEAAGMAARTGWRAYRADSLEHAAERFAEALRRCPGNLDARNGVAYTALRGGQTAAADSIFRSILAQAPANGDAWAGLAFARNRAGDRFGATEAARRAVALSPANDEARRLLLQLDPDAERPPLVPHALPATLQLPARTRGTGFEVARPGGGWRPFHIKGVNLGVALPGRFPAEFPADSARYAGWIDTIAAMHANTLRVYTILPPAFYRALRAWNIAHPDRILWLVHGVWTELPPHHDFDDAGWKTAFRAEMRRVVDLVHGAADLPPRPGHASGRYDADVSAWTLAYIIGREWEPYAVTAFDAAHPEARAYRGRYLEVVEGAAMDVWLAEQCDHLLAYEADRYNALRPIAYTNWPTLDPLAHPTEAGAAEERAWWRRAGRPIEGRRLEYENDALGLDANLVRPTAANPAGWFASYHAYPYYPDFLLLDSAYGEARSSEGPSRWFGYLQALVRHHADIPVVVAEYGVPSSRGIAHLQPQGWHHGGHDEQAMARIDARLTREIREAGAAGGIVFAWMDEWFKRNWIVLDFQIPADHAPRWHNVMDAEQHYGILGQYAGDEATTPRLGGDPARWRALPTVNDGRRPGTDPFAPTAMRMGQDEAYVYVAVEFGNAGGGSFPWHSAGLQIAIDTYERTLGQHRLPNALVRSEIGFEFLVDLPHPDSATLRIVPEYDRHARIADPATGDDLGRFLRRPVTIARRDDGRFDSLLVVTNRARFGRDGTFYPAAGYDRGRLAFGTEAASTRSDWFFDERAGVLELRIAWDLLNVSDPSSRRVLFERDAGGALGTATTESFRLGVLAYRKGAAPAILGGIPAAAGGRWRAADFTAWSWEPWEAPRSHARLKPVYDSLRTVWTDHDTATHTPGAP